MKFFSLMLPLLLLVNARISFNNAAHVSDSESRRNDSLSSSSQHTSDVLLADAGNDKRATDAKHKRSSSAFLPPSSSSARGQSSPNYFRELLSRSNDGIVEVQSPHENFRGSRTGMPFRYTREVHVKQGRLIGIVREMSSMRLKNVDQFLGIPYASAQRFMPPSSPLPWQNVKYANKLASVCPQKLPNLSDPSGYNKGRYDQIKRILPFLKNESEDCLHLNLYVPSFDDSIPLQRNYPVIVFLHESFEWNSGNSYDGSILASYGQIIVITLNYRLGALGFLKPGLNDQTVANFGLLDIIAALQWIKENIESFGGNKNLVTLLGYDHGAIFANFLMISPIARGLFHRTILMSGSALADWALNYNPQQITQQVAKQLNCPMEDIQLGDCLRGKSYREIMNVSVMAPEFSTIFGPIVDGLVVPSEPHQVMAHNEAFGKFDLLFGMTELESFNILGRDGILNGISQADRDHNIRKYLATRFDKRLEVAFMSTLKEYDNAFMKSKSMSFHDHRDILLEILSDARVAAPLIHTGVYLSRRNPKCYMYVFAHNSEAGEHATISQSIHGEDLPFVFGAPLGDAGPFQTLFNGDERLLSEAVMRYFSNFAKTGNPTVPWPHRFHNLKPDDWSKYDVDWHEFNEINQNYLLLGTQPIVSQRYRHKYTKFWNENLIETMRNANSLNEYGKLSNSPLTPRNLPALSASGKVINMYPIEVQVEQTEDPLREIHYRLRNHRDPPMTYSRDAFQSRGHTYGTALTSSATESIEQVPSDEHEILTNEATTMYLLISIVVAFLLVNLVALFVYLYRRNKKIHRKYDHTNIFDAVSDDKRSKFNDTDDSFILDIIRKSSNNTYESVKRHSLINGYGISREMSTSTVDTHTKVNDWISNEITKYGNGHIGTSQHSKQNSFSTTGGGGSSGVGGKKEKVSVAIDATPQARSNSILRQEPIEVTKAKSLDYGMMCGGGKIICQEVDLDVSMIDEVGIYSNNRIDGSIDERNESDSSSCSCSSFSQCCEECAIHALKMPYHQIHADESRTSFMNDSVNVTSRDSPALSPVPLSHEESLKAIQKMNCPKVLPNYPEHVQLNDATKRRSLQVPPQYYQIHGEGSSWDTFNRQNSSSSSSSSTTCRPEPPPRLSSTLGRRPSRNEDRSSNFMTMPLKAAEPPQPVIPVDTTESTLIVGPIIPKSESIYMTMQRKRSLSRQNSTSSSTVATSTAEDEDEVNRGAPEDNSKVPTNYESDSKTNDERFNDAPIYSEIIKNSRVQAPKDAIHSITAAAAAASIGGNKHLERKSSANSQESNSSTSSSSASSTGTIKKIN